MRSSCGRLLVALLLLASIAPPLRGQDGAPAREPVVRARVVHDFALDGELTEWGTPQIELGDENRVFSETNPTLSRSWSGPEDLSGRIWVGYTVDELVLAGEIRDDVALTNPRDWWLGDEIEVFLDLDVSPDEPEPHVYNEDDYQLLLFPQSEGRKWGFTAAADLRGKGDGGFDGIRVISRQIPDDEGVYRGYTFEAVIPLVNFPGLSVRRGATIGFDVALVDADEKPEQKTYMTASGRSDLATDPSRFGRLVFDEDLPAPRAERPAPGFSWGEPAGILLGAAVLLVLLWRFRRFLTPVTELSVRGKLTVMAVLLALLLVGRAIPVVVQASRRAGREDLLQGKVAVLRETLAEVADQGLLGTSGGPGDADGVWALLTEPEGCAVPPARYVYTPRWLSPPQASSTLSRTPVIRYRRTLHEGESATFGFEPPRPVAAAGVVLVSSFDPDPTSRRPLAPEHVVATVRTVTETGEVHLRPLRYGRETHDAESPDNPGAHGLPGLSVAWTDSARGRHADELRIPFETTLHLVRVEVLQQTAEGDLTVEGVTLLPPDEGEPIPLPMVTPTLIGVPTNLWEDGPRGASVGMGPGSEPVRYALEPPVDRLWVFYVQPGIRAPGGPRAGSEVAALTLLDAEGEALRTTVLERDVHVDAEVLFSLRGHPPGFRGRMAFRWTPQGQHPRHRDIVALDATGAAALEVAYRGQGEPFLLAGVTQGELIPHVPALDLDHLTYDAETGGYRLRDASRAALAGLELTWYRKERAERTTLSREEGREAIVGTALPASARTGEPVVRTLAGHDYLAAHLAVAPGTPHLLEASVPLPGAGRVAFVADLASYGLLALLLLDALLVVADLLYRMSRIRTKLTLGFAIAAMVPLLLFFFGLSGILEREVGGTETRTLREQLALVKGKIEELRDDVRRRARRLLDHPALARTLPPGELEDYVNRTDAAVREIAARSDLPGPVRVFVEDSFPVGEDRGPRVFPTGELGHPFYDFVGPADDITYRWSRIVLAGIASRPEGEGRRAVAVELNVGAELLESLRSRFGQRFELLLFTLRGHPYAGTLELAGERGAARMRARRKLAAAISANRQPVLREESLAGAAYSVAYDLLLDSEHEPVALLAVALPRKEFIAARADIRNLFLILGAVILVLEVIVGNILTRRITDPLTSLSRGARAVAKGRLRTRVEVAAPDEIGNLARSFNRMTEELGRRIEELRKLNAAIGAFSGSLERELVLERAVHAFRDTSVPPDALAIVLAREEDAEIVAGHRGAEPLPPRRLDRGEGIAEWALGRRKPEVRADLGPEVPTPPERGAFGPFRSAAAIPFDAGRETRGAVLLLFERPEPGLSRGDLEFLSTLAQQVAIALENSRLYQLAIEDPATGLYVHTYFLARLREEVDRAVAGDRPLSLILVSLEELGGIYDAHGPEEGDHLLGAVVSRVGAATSGMHIMARADRETLEILLPEATKEAALEAARGYREALGRAAFPLAGDPSAAIHVSAAIGLSTCPDDAKSADFLLAEANQALYMAVRDRAGTRLVDMGRERERTRARVEGKGGPYVFRSEKMIEILETVERIANSEVPILVQGETGVGKEVIAEVVHERSERRTKPLVKLNCAALPETLLESELFGYERGAFTGADRTKPGRFETADGGTIFLDEVGEMPPQTQVKLLRVLQDHRLERLGGTGSIQVDVRVIAATNRDLLAAIREGRFREDLYFRLNVVSVAIPPLRARKEEIPALVDHFVTRYRRTHRTTAKRLGPGAMDRLFAHSWPGNVRELRNTIERALVIARGEEVRADEIVFPDRPGEEAPEEEGAPAKAEAPAPVPEAEGLNVRQRRLLEILSRRETITNREYASLVGVSSRTGNRDLKELIARGLIEQMGRRRAAVYRLRG